MGVATAISLGLGLASTGVSVYQGIQGAKAESKANEAAAAAAKDAERITEMDKFASLEVPTLGLELAQQNIQARQAASVQALREMGPAGALGGLTQVGLQAQAQDQALAAQAEQLQYQRDLAQAQNAQQIEANRVARQAGLVNARLGGAQTAAAEGRNTQNQAISGALQGLSSAAQLYAYQDIYGNKNAKPQVPASNATSVASIQKSAQDAFKPQIAAMQPRVSPVNVQNQLQSNAMAGLRGAQGQYDVMQANQLAGLRSGQGQFDSQYTFNPYNNQWNQNAPY
jgi:hypothetical protein